MEPMSESEFEPVPEAIAGRYGVVIPPRWERLLSNTTGGVFRGGEFVVRVEPADPASVKGTCTSSVRLTLASAFHLLIRANSLSQRLAVSRDSPAHWRTLESRRRNSLRHSVVDGHI